MIIFQLVEFTCTAACVGSWTALSLWGNCYHPLYLSGKKTRTERTSSYGDHSAEHPVEVVYDLVVLKGQLIDACRLKNKFLWSLLP